MKRALQITAVLLAATGASPPNPLPIPPIPPAQPPLDQSAPIPDRDAQAPATGGQQGVQVGLKDFRVQRFYQGLGYAPGSHFETNEEKRPIQTPGVTLQVPLQ